MPQSLRVGSKRLRLRTCNRQVLRISRTKSQADLQGIARSAVLRTWLASDIDLSNAIWVVARWACVLLSYVFVQWATDFPSSDAKNSLAFRATALNDYENSEPLTFSTCPVKIRIENDEDTLHDLHVHNTTIIHDLIFKSQEAHVSNGVRYEESLHSVQILAESRLLQSHEQSSQVRPVSTFGSGILLQKPGGPPVFAMQQTC